GSPTATDRLLASRMGVHAVELLKEDIGGKAVGIRGDEVFSMDLEEALHTTKPSHVDFKRISDILS
ncbi:MAG: ATP-dependent 6-phosphofructokinase, partial [Bacillota bacterium]|nr:ATP-dependent 6-phosphofructokinase [Bacillota bacterium]